MRKGRNVFAQRLGDLIKEVFCWSGGGRRMLRKPVEPVTTMSLERENECAGGAWCFPGKGARST